MLYYWGGKYGTQLKRGEGYIKLRPVRSIVIAEFPILPMLERLHAVFELRSRENSDVKFSDHCQMHVLRLGNLVENNLVGLDQFGLDLQRWMQFWALGEKLEVTSRVIKSPSSMKKQFSGAIGSPIFG